MRLLQVHNIPNPGHCVVEHLIGLFIEVKDLFLVKQLNLLELIRFRLLLGLVTSLVPLLGGDHLVDHDKKEAGAEEREKGVVVVDVEIEEGLDHQYYGACLLAVLPGKYCVQTAHYNYNRGFGVFGILGFWGFGEQDVTERVHIKVTYCSPKPQNPVLNFNLRLNGHDWTLILATRSFSSSKNFLRTPCNEHFSMPLSNTHKSDAHWFRCSGRNPLACS